MATPASHSPDYLSEVFRFLSARRRAVVRTRGQAYTPFQSSFHAVHSTLQDTATLPVRTTNTATDQEETGRPATKTVSQSKEPPLAFQSFSTAPPAARREASKVKVADYAAATRPQRSSPPPLFSSDHALPSFERSVPHSAAQVPLSWSFDRRKALDLDDSVGSFEFPTEQQPDGEFLSPVLRQEFASTSKTPLASAASLQHAGRAAGNARELGSLGNVPSRDSETNDCLTSVNHAASFPCSRRHASIPVLEAAAKAARSCSLASLLEQHGAQLFLADDSPHSFPGTRRVSLRRLVFDTDDDDDDDDDGNEHP